MPAKRRSTVRNQIQSSALAGAGLGSLFAGIGGLLARGTSKRRRKRFKNLLAAVEANAKRAQQAAEARILESPQFAFLTEAFEDPLGGGFGREAASRIQQAQAARGLAFGGSAAAQEGTFLARLADQRRQQLLPLFLRSVGAAADLGQQAFEREFTAFNLLQGAPQRVSSGDVFGSIAQGLFGGAQAGAGIGLLQSLQPQPAFPTNFTPETPVDPFLSPAVQNFQFDPRLEIK